MPASRSSSTSSTTTPARATTSVPRCRSVASTTTRTTASALARELHDVDKLGSFFDIIHQDPTISQVKLIAEPWDVGPGGYQVGNFPVGWAEWNGRYRDTVRRFWKGVGGQAAELAYRLSGSSGPYARP